MGEHRIKEQNAERQGDDMAELIAKKLEKLPEESRLPLAQEMIHFIGKLVELWEQHKPMTVAKAAAFMFFVEQLHIEKTDEKNAFAMLEMVGAARAAMAELRGDGGN